MYGAHETHGCEEGAIPGSLRPNGLLHGFLVIDDENYRQAYISGLAPLFKGLVLVAIGMNLSEFFKK